MNSDEIIEILCQNGFPSYIVGGAVRDFLLGIQCHDEDICTQASPEEILKIFNNHDVNAKQVHGKSFPVVHLDGIEVATFRQDDYEGLSDKNVTITKTDSLLTDLERRDFTINSMALCIKTGNVIDPFNGRDDLQSRTIKFTGDAEKRIFEDPNRILRACRFIAKIDGEFHPDTKSALIKHKDLMKHVAPERIRKEILSAMKIRKASKFFSSMIDIDILKYVIPELECGYGHDHGAHHIEDIYTHNMLCGDAINTKNSLLKLAGYLHDIGKPYACRFNEKSSDIAFTAHDKKGRDIVEEILKRLKFSDKEIKYISTLVRRHMSVFKSDKSIRRIIYRLGDISPFDLLRLKMADTKANLKKGQLSLSLHKKIIRDIRRNLEKPESFVLNIDGMRIMELTGLKPGKEIGAIKKNLMDLVLEDSERNAAEILEEIVLNNWKEILKGGSK